MEVGDGRLPARVVNDRVYVAVGKDVREGRSTLSWALNNFGGHFRIIHVHQPHQLNPSPHPFYGSGSRNPQELARQEMESILDEYIHMCSQAGVPAQKRHVEMQDIGKGIVELIEQHAITKLVMGAAADRHYFEGMAQLTSAKAKFVNQHAHPSCRIWFVCNGHVIYSREGDLSTFDMDITPSVLPGRSVVESGLQNTRSPSLDSVHSRSNSSEVEDDLALVQFEDPERSDESSARSPVPAVHQPPSSVADDLALVQFEDPERSDESSARSPVPAVHQPPSSVADNLALVQFEDPERSDESSARSPVPAVHQPPSSVADNLALVQFEDPERSDKSSARSPVPAVHQPPSSVADNLALVQFEDPERSDESSARSPVPAVHQPPSSVADNLALVQFEDPERSDESSARSPVPAVHQPPSSVADDLASVQFEDPERSNESSARSPVPAVHQPPSSVADNLALVQFEDPERSDESSARSPVPAVHQPPSSVADDLALVQFEDPERSDESSARSPVPAVHQPPSSVSDNLALVQFEDPERSDESSARSPVPAVHQPPSSVAEGINSEELCEQLHRAMSEVTKAKREALQELIRRQKAEKAAIEAKRKVGALENSHAEESIQRINLKEMLEKERERCKMIENERDDLQMLFENALKANEELSSHQAGDL